MEWIWRIEDLLWYGKCLKQEECRMRIERARFWGGNLKDSWSGEMGFSGTVKFSVVMIKSFYVPSTSPTKICFGHEDRCLCPPLLHHAVVCTRDDFRRHNGQSHVRFLLQTISGLLILMLSKVLEFNLILNLVCCFCPALTTDSHFVFLFRSTQGSRIFSKGEVGASMSGRKRPFQPTFSNENFGGGTGRTDAQ